MTDGIDLSPNEQRELMIATAKILRKYCIKYSYVDRDCSSCPFDGEYSCPCGWDFLEE